MASEHFLYTLLTKSFTVLAWPPFTLLCPLFVSVRAMESDSHSSNQQCLAFWVLFSLFMIMERELSVLLNCLPWWPHVKSIATILLLIPYVGAAPHVYKFLIRYYGTQNLFTRISNIFSQKSIHFESDEDSKFVDASDHTILTNQIQEMKLEVYQDIGDLACCDKTESSYAKLAGEKQVQKEWSCALCQISTGSAKCLRSHLKGKEHKDTEKDLRVEFHVTNSTCLYQDIGDLACCDKTESSYAKLAGEKQVQKEWSCALCQISTGSAKCLRSHLKGKKHKDKEKDLRVEFHVTNSTYLLSSTQKRVKGMALLRNLNQIANILSPVSRSIRWCEWTKPEFGWTKLNTDGSIQRESASFGGLLRDYRGKPICAFVSKAPQGDVFLVELWAIWRGLVLSLSLGIKSIWVESDSMSVVKTVNREQLCPKAYTYLKQIWKLLKKFDEYRISHSWRETNRAADHLAKMVFWENDVVLWPVNFPPHLCSIIKDDAEGKKYLRR